MDRQTTKLSTRNKLAFFISLLSFFFLIPGIYLSMITIESKGAVSAKVPHVEYNLFGVPNVTGSEHKRIKLNILDTTRSILKITHDLWKRNYFFVASMIFLFSVIIPVGKGSLLTCIFFTKNAETRRKIFDFIKSIGKWSMCDVFITAVFLTFLSTDALGSHSNSTTTLMNFQINMDVLVNMQAHLQTGFWCFLTYCILSLCALQLYESF